MNHAMHDQVAEGIKAELHDFDIHPGPGKVGAFNPLPFLGKVDAFTQQYLAMIQALTGAVPGAGPELQIVEGLGAKILHMIVTELPVTPPADPSVTPTPPAGQ